MKRVKNHLLNLGVGLLAIGGIVAASACMYGIVYLLIEFVWARWVAAAVGVLVGAWKVGHDIRYVQAYEGGAAEEVDPNEAAASSEC